MKRNIDSKMPQTIFKICSCPAWGLVKTKTTHSVCPTIHSSCIQNHSSGW